MIRELSKNVASLGPVAALTLRDAGLGEVARQEKVFSLCFHSSCQKRPVLCVRNTDAALDAFVELQQAGVSGGAIINGEVFVLFCLCVFCLVERGSLFRESSWATCRDMI